MADFKSGPRAHLDEWVAPDIADELGFLRAGKILEWMDVVGVLAATRHCRRPGPRRADSSGKGWPAPSRATAPAE